MLIAGRSNAFARAAIYSPTSACIWDYSAN
jgi:hypothetical protein